MDLVILGALATLFHHIGENEYHGKGWLFVLILIGLTLLGWYFLPLGMLTPILVAGFFYLGLIVVNVITGHLPGPGTGTGF